MAVILKEDWSAAYCLTFVLGKGRRHGIKRLTPWQSTCRCTCDNPSFCISLGQSSVTQLAGRGERLLVSGSFSYHSSQKVLSPFG